MQDFSGTGRSAQADLFPISSAVRWLPDETLYSLTSRYHLLSGHTTAALTSQRLFGHARGGFSSDFPSRIASFASRTREQLGDAISILYNRTIAPAYLPYLNSADANAAVNAFCGASIGSLKQTLGMARASSSGTRRLKACARCMTDDRKIWGTTYWHRAHQLPAAWVCLEHGEPLLASTVEGSGIASFQWHLPSSQQLHATQGGPAESSATGKACWALLRRLSIDAQCLAGLPEKFEFEPGRLSATYRNALHRIGFRDVGNGKAGAAAVRRCYLGFVAPIVGMQDFRSLGRTVSKLQSPPERYRIDPDPVKHLILSAWLFESWGDFLSSYSATQARS